MNPKTFVFVGHSAGLHGAERSMLDIVQRCVAQGHHAVVFLPEDGSLVERCIDSGATVRIVRTRSWMGPRHRGLGGAVRLAQCLIDAVRHWWALGSIRPNVVVTNTSVTPSSAVAARLRGIPHVWLIREPLLDGVDSKSLVPKAAILAFVRRSSVAVGVISDFVRSQLPGNVENVFSLQPNPVISDRRSPSVSRHDPLELLVIGRISVEKGQLIAVEALALAASGARLTIVGSGSPVDMRGIRDRVQELALGDRVSFQDWTDDPWHCIRKSDVVLMTSLNEPYGRVTSEALQLGRPVIGLPAGGTPEVVGQYVEFLATDCTPRGLASKIDEFARASDDEYRSLVARAWERGNELAAAPRQFDRILAAACSDLPAPRDAALDQ